MFQRGQRFAQRLAQGFRLGRRPHAAWPGQQQRIAEVIAQPGQVDADRWLREVQALRGACHVVLGQQHVQRDQQVEVESPEISHGNTCNIGYSFPIYRVAA
ncbi:hypothetical protein D3C72_2324470 [compost metagenome]